MNTRFTRDYYHKAKPNSKGEYIVNESKICKMWHLSITENYFIEDKEEALKQAIKDLEKELEKLKDVENKRAKAMESWDSISK